jgi:membrane protein DedA with SNARE-associated domain
VRRLEERRGAAGGHRLTGANHSRWGRVPLYACGGRSPACHNPVVDEDPSVSEDPSTSGGASTGEGAVTGPEDAVGPASAATGAPSRSALAAVVVAIAALVVANNVGNALAAALLPDPADPARSSNPLLLIALSPAIRNQVAVANYVEPWQFLAVAGLRLLVADPLFFLLGRWYGDAGISWMERRSPLAGETLREIERWFAKAAPVVVFIASNNLVCTLAGASGMRRVTFWVANVAGTIARLVLILFLAGLAADQIDTVLTWIGDYRPWVIGISVAAVAVVGLRQLRGARGEIDQLRNLDERTRSGESDTPGPDGRGGGSE